MPESTFNTTRRKLIGVAAATLLLSVSRVGFAASSQVVALRIWPSNSYTRITVEASEPIAFKQFSLSDPNRLVIDLQGVQLNSVLRDIGNQINANDPYIKTARAGQFDANTVRVVLELKTDVKPQTFTLAPVAEYRHRLVVDLYSAQEQADPLLALLQDYNKGTLQQPAPQIKPKKPEKGRPLIVVIDPGHGGEDPGAVGLNGTREKDVVLRIAKQIKRLIDAEGNMKAYLTRDEDVFIPLGFRVAKARKLNADLFVSVHADAAPNRSAQGSSVYALAERSAKVDAFAKALADKENSSDLIGGVKIKGGDQHLNYTLADLTQTATINDSLKLGKMMLGHLGGLNKLHKRGVEQAGFAVLKAPDIPSVLVETAFISNAEEEQKLLSNDFQQKMAAAIFAGIRNYFAQSPILASRD